MSRIFRVCFCASILALVVAKATILKVPIQNVSVSLADVQNTAPMQKLTALKLAIEEEESPIMRQIFSVVFPFGTDWNAVLATFYISSFPNFILAFIPSQINPNTLNTMTAFATGGLLSDVFLHLVPHSFMGENPDPSVHFVMVEEKRNILVGLAVFIGFASFFVMEKTLRVLGGDEEGSHGHSHSHSPAETTAVHTSGVDVSSANGLTSRHNAKSNGGVSESVAPAPATAVSGPSKVSAYLNLFGDFVHNITDGLAITASFYASPAIGATTSLACLLHEVPHELADYSILVRSGFTKKQAMQSQFLTAVGAFLGTFIGIAVRNFTSAGQHGTQAVDLAAGIRQDASGILGTTLSLEDLVLPAVAGGFLYIGAVAVLPTLLAESKSAAQALREFAAMAFGVLCMFLVAWNE